MRVTAPILLALVLAGCATPVVPLPERSYAGRFSATATRGTERENVSGRFTFEVRGPEQRLDLATPLGSTLARIEIGPDGARASGTQLREVRGPDADTLAEQLLGWRLPVSGLADWLEARPVAGRPAHVERNGDRVVRIEQDGWTIDFAGDEAPRPRRLQLQRPAAPLAPAVDLRLVLDDAS